MHPNFTNTLKKIHKSLIPKYPMLKTHQNFTYVSQYLKNLKSSQTFII